MSNIISPAVIAQAARDIGVVWDSVETEGAKEHAIELTKRLATLIRILAERMPEVTEQSPELEQQVAEIAGETYGTQSTDELGQASHAHVGYSTLLRPHGAQSKSSTIARAHRYLRTQRVNR